MFWEHTHCPTAQGFHLDLIPECIRLDLIVGPTGVRNCGSRERFEPCENAVYVFP